MRKESDTTGIQAHSVTPFPSSDTQTAPSSIDTAPQTTQDKPN